ncbi:MAG: phosphate ABC transporter substrate-binding protein PstS [Syntrophobacteraceae bacterium]
MSIRKHKAILTAGVLALGLAAGSFMGAPQAGAAEKTVSLLETGSSLVYPLFNIWIPQYAQIDPNVKITTQSTGSGTGISQSVAGLAQIGASDAYMSNALMKQHPMLNIPLCISMQMANYNLPGLNDKNIKLSGPVLAGIYSGKIRFWDDPTLKKLNPGVDLPHHEIIPVHRTDGSGDTFIFTQYLTFSTPEWSKGTGYGTTVSWPPVPGGLGAEGNPGMVTATKDNPYTVSYIGTSYQDAIKKDKLGIAMLENHDGKFLLPTEKTAKAAAAALVSKTPANECISLIFAPGPDSYPIINYEYVMIKARQDSPQTAAALRKFLTWAISPTGGNAPKFMQQVHFIALPAPIVELSSKQIAKIK